MNKIRIYHFNNGGGGGVLSVTKNLLRYAVHPGIEHHIIYTINRDNVENYPINNIEGAHSERVFYYSPRWNFYYTSRQLAKLLPDEQAVIIANDWIELGMASNLGLQNKVIQILHGDYGYYYELAKKHAGAIDAYITVAVSMRQKLQALLPARHNDIECIHFPVPGAICSNELKEMDTIMFAGRCEEAKGYHLLPQIAEKLRSKNIHLHWHIAGEAKEGARDVWPAGVSVQVYGLLPNEAVNSLFCRMQYFILPSVAEGMPVSLIESMKAGVIPIMNNLQGGVQELIKDGITGYLAKTNTADEYVQIIESLVNSSNKNFISNNCRTLANELFNPLVNTKQYETLFEKVATDMPAEKQAKKIYGSRLDQPWMPNLVTKLIRSLN